MRVGDKNVLFISSGGIRPGLVTESGKAEFQSDKETNLAMFVTMLHRLELKPSTEEGSSFTDVAGSNWYLEAAAWGNATDIVEGYSDGAGNFGGADPMTREQMAVFMFRYAHSLGMDTSARAELEFADAESVSEWADEAMSWAMVEGLFTGDDETGELRLTNGATRAEAAAVIMRLISAMHA